MNVLFVTNIPSPYRVDFFNELGKYCRLTVCYERKTSAERNNKWRALDSISFEEVYLPLIPVGPDRSKGSAICSFIKYHHKQFDYIVLTNYSSQSERMAIYYCIRHRINYCIEYDGGFDKKDSFLKRIIKKSLLLCATAHFTTCSEHINYLTSLGIKKERIIKYPFSSVLKKDIVSIEDISAVRKQQIRKELCISGNRILLSVGQFIHRKGFDILIQAMAHVDERIQCYIVGDEPTQEYIDLIEKYCIKNVHFIGFKSKEELKKWYIAADVFVLPTREDIWGLVINEAMAHGLPIVTTRKCIAGLEMVIDGYNGFLIAENNVTELNEAISHLFSRDIIGYLSNGSLKTIQSFTIEKMAEFHVSYFNSMRK